MLKYTLFFIIVLQALGPALFAKAKTANNGAILCDGIKPQSVLVEPGKVTVLSFPLPPKEVLPGSPIFDFKQIRNDLAIKSMRPTGHTNVVIYLPERRCIFNVRAVSQGGQDVLVVQDPKDNLINLEFK
jgi:hypothetical protein